MDASGPFSRPRPRGARTPLLETIGIGIVLALMILAVCLS